MLAIKNLNNIIQFGKPVPVILNRTAGLGYLCSKGDNPVLSTNNSSHILPVYDKTVPGCNKHRIIHI